MECGNSVLDVNEACDDGSLNGQPNQCNLQCSAVLPSLILSYTFDDFISPYIFDSSVFGNTGTISGATLIPDGVVGDALEFDGIDDDLIVEYDSSFDLIGTEAFTVSLWVKIPLQQATVTDNLGTAFTTNSILEKWNGGPDTPYPYAIRLNNGNSANPGTIVVSRSDDGFNGVSATSTAAVNDGQWHHIAMVKSSGETTFRLFIDGNLESIVPDTIGSSPVSLVNDDAIYIGRRGDGDHIFEDRRFYFTGSIDEVQIFKRGFTDSEVRSLLYNLFLCGDANLDGEFNIVDVLATVNQVIGTVTLSDTNLVDVIKNPDGTSDGINIRDVLQLIQKIIDPTLELSC